MITSHEREKLNRDLNQIGQWVDEYRKNLPDEYKQDLRIDEAYKNLKGTLRELRDHLENKARVGQ